MNLEIRPFIVLPLDGYETSEEVLQALHNFFADEDEEAKLLTSHVKVNDALHNPDCSGPVLVKRIKEVIRSYNSQAKIFVDLKIADTKGTNKNTLKHYAKFLEAGDIVTIRSDCSLEGFLFIKKILPDITLTLVSALTDMTREECIRRFGVAPEVKINRDMRGLLEEADFQSTEPPFDAVVCSPKELDFLYNQWETRFEFIVPSIRDAWMKKGQQARSTGVAFALNHCATFVVSGSQMMKGNPDANISAAQSRKMTITEAKKSWRLPFVPGDLKATLINLGGYYYCGRNESGGQLLGPLVAYAGTYDDGGNEKNWIGAHYVNLAKIEALPPMLSMFVADLAEKITAAGLSPDKIVGVPTGGSYWGSKLAESMELGFAEVAKVKIADTNKGAGKREESSFKVARHEINAGEKVIIVEDLVNNFSSTAKVVKAVEIAGGEVIGIACAFNRSVTVTGDDWEGIPIVGLVKEPIPQYKQDDPEVVDLVEADQIVWKARNEWPVLQKAMQDNGIA